MTHVGMAIVTGLLTFGGAQAKTYQWTYTGGAHLMPVQGYEPIKHVKRLVVTLSSPTPFPKGTCSDVPQGDIVGLTDGKDTLGTLEADGYGFAKGSEISVCTDAAGKAISSWILTIGLNKAAKKGNENRSYVAFTQSTETQNNEYYDSVAFFPVGYNNPVKGMENVETPGSWKLQVMK